MLLCYILFIQLNLKRVSIEEFYSIFYSLNYHNFLFGLLAFFLMPINWLLESFKWKKLVYTIQDNFTFFSAIRGVLIGVFFGFVTPNRIGEFGGRLFKIHEGNKVKALNLSLVGGFAQFVITFLVGITFSFYLILNYFELSSTVAYILIVLIYFITISIFFNFKKIVKFLLDFQQFQKFSDKYVFNFDLSKLFLFEILLITFIRYCVYVFQYVFILFFLGIDLEVLFLVKIISSMLLIQTIIPSFTLLDVGVRGNALLFLLSNYVDNQLIILVSVLLVWILNLVTPAIIGYLNFINLNLPVKNEKSNNNIITNN